MAQGGKDSQKQEDTQSGRARKVCLDKLNEDGIRKELYRNERKAQEYWDKKWGFLRNSEKLQQEEMAKQGLPQDMFDLKKKQQQQQQQMTLTEPKGSNPALELSSTKVPLKTSEMIGWRLITQKNELNRLVGPMYVSRKLTMNPPLGEDEPDITTQKIIFLG